MTVDGQPRRIVVQATKQGWAYTFDRATGEPVWPIEERPVPPSEVPGERLSPTQPMPTRPAAYEMQGLTEDDLIDFTPELRAEAIEIAGNYRLGPIFNPPIQRGHPSGLRSFVSCPSGASNIFGPTSADPETGILYVSTRRGCRSENIVPGAAIDVPEDIKTTGRTIAEFAVLNRGDFRGPQGLPIYKPPYARIVAIDMNTGEQLWETPNGDTPERVRNHPALQGVDLPNTGRDSHPVTMVTRTLVITAEGTGGTPRLHALDKRTGARVGTVELPASGQYGMMGYLHEGRQYIVVQVAGAGLPGSLAGAAPALTAFRRRWLPGGDPYDLASMARSGDDVGSGRGAPEYRCKNGSTYPRTLEAPMRATRVLPLRSPRHRQDDLAQAAVSDAPRVPGRHRAAAGDRGTRRSDPGSVVASLTTRCSSAAGSS